MTEQELAGVIWDIKEIIRNLYDDSEVEDVILPFTLLRRLDCCLDAKALNSDKTIREVVMEQLKALPADAPEQMKRIKLSSLMKKQKITFFNTSGLSLEKLLGAPDQIGSAFATYLEGFTENVKDILANFVHTDSSSEVVDLSAIYARLDRHDKLFAVVQLFVQRADLDPEVVSNAMMGTVFEMVIQKSKESTNTKAGQFYTPREIVRLLVALTMCGREKELYEPGRHFSIYDPCCGTGGMLTEGKKYLQEVSGREDMKVYLYGQELNEKTYAICKSDLLMKGDDQNLDEQVFRGDTLADDRLRCKKFNFMLANPPFGVDWGKDTKTKAAVERENCVGGRFEAGLPSTSDGSLLFLLHMISKMDEENGSRIGIVLNGSPLFNGDAGGGWSNIRKMLLDKNLLDCIVALPKNLFYGTDISTYLWIVDNKRPAEREGKVLFINAAYKEYTTLLQKNLGKKRFDVSDAGAADILELYRAYQPATREIVYEKTGEVETLEIAKVLDYDDLLYTNVATRRPLRLWYQNIAAKYEALCSDEAFKADDKKNQILKEVAEVKALEAYEHFPCSDSEFFEVLKQNKVKFTAAQVKQLRSAFGTVAEDAPEVYDKPLDKKSGFVADSALNDTEKIPMKRDIDEYFATEVLPFAPDAWMERDKDKVGCEIPFTRIFYKFRPLRSSADILAELSALDGKMEKDLANLKVED